MSLQIESAYLWALAPPIIICLAGWVLLLPRNKLCIYLGCRLIYLSVWVLSIAVLWVGVVFAFAGWVWPMIFEAEKDSTPVQKIASAIAAWVLLFVGKQILELRHLKIAAEILKRIIQISFKGRVPKTLPIGANATSQQRLAYRAFNDDRFASDNVPEINGWGMDASYRRLKLIDNL